jgi:hypothetical protein
MRFLDWFDNTSYVFAIIQVIVGGQQTTVGRGYTFSFTSWSDLIIIDCTDSVEELNAQFPDLFKVMNWLFDFSIVAWF